MKTHWEIGTLQFAQCYCPSKEVAHTLDTMHDAHSVLCFENHGQDSRVRGPLVVSPTIHRKTGTGGNNVPLVLHRSTFALDQVLVSSPTDGGVHA